MERRPLMIAHLLFGSLFIPCSGHAQSPVYSESIIKYDWHLPNNGKSIPFDRPFTMIVDNVPAKSVTAIYAFETIYKDGKRKFKENKVHGEYQPVKDIKLSKDLDSDTLRIFFPALKPNKNFDVYILRLLSDENRALVMKMNMHMKLGETEKAKALFLRLENNVRSKYADLTPLALTFTSYKNYYHEFLEDSYNTLSDPAAFPAAPALSLSEIKAIDISTSSLLDFKDGHLLLEAVSKNKLPQLQNGVLDIRKIYQPEDDTVSMADIDARLQNVVSNRVFFDTIYRRIGAVLSKGTQTVTVDHQVQDLSKIYKKTNAICKNLWLAYEKLEEGQAVISAMIDKNENMRQMDFLIGTTESYDIKTAGGNVLFLDAGISNLRVAGVNTDIVNIPKLYWGVSIYFRPIDKNTRRNRFPYAWQLPAYKGTEKYSINLADNKVMAAYGLDTSIAYNFHLRKKNLQLLLSDELQDAGDDTTVYTQSVRADQRIVSRYTLFQHLSLNVGLTLGSMGNKDFDNLYNNTSLLVGPAFRFARTFKISAGVSFVKRSSNHPLVSEKEVVVGNYISLSTDIDFIQGLKDITSILFK